MPYTVVNAAGAGVGGLMTIPEEAAKMGARAGLDRLHLRRRCRRDRPTASKKAGGKVHRRAGGHPRRRPIFRRSRPAGRDVHAACARKARISRQCPAEPLGHVGWRELYTDGWEKALDFYSSQFGWTKDQSVDMGEMGTYQLFAIDGEQAGGMMNRPPNVPVAVLGFLLQRRRHRCRRGPRDAKWRADHDSGRWRCRAAAGSSTARTRKALFSPWSAWRSECSVAVG